MASTKNYGLAGVGADVQFGKSGGRFVYDAGNGVFKFTSDGATLIAARGSDPVTDDDLTTKRYVDSVASGLDPKQSVRVATTANLGATYSASGGSSGTGGFTSAPNTIDGIALANGDRILVKDQNTATQNGIYVVVTAGTGSNGSWERAPDHDGTPASEVSSGNFVFVEEGTTNESSGWVLQGSGVLTLNTDNLDWVQFSGAGLIDAGAGLSKTGNTLNLDLNDLTSDTIALGDSLAFYDTSGSDTNKTTVQNMLDGLDIPYSITSNGLVVRTAADTYNSRSIAVEGAGHRAGLSVSNGDGTAGNPTLGLNIEGLTSFASTLVGADSIVAYDASADANQSLTFTKMLQDLDIAFGFSSNGILVRTAADTYASRTITVSGVGAADGLSITNGDAAAGNPVIGLDITGTPEIGEAVADTDYLLIYNASTGANQKVSVSTLAANDSFGETNSIAQGNSDVTVTDAGTGSITINPDGETVVTVTASGMTVSTGNTLTVTDLSNNRVVYTGTAGVLTSSANLTFNGSTLSVTGQLNADNLRLDGNTLSSTNSNGNIIIDTNGTGVVQINASAEGIIAADTAQDLTLRGGSSSNATAAGDLNLSGGLNSSTGAGGNIIIQAGNSTSGTDGVVRISDVNGNEIIEFLNGTSAVNHISVTPGATGTGPSISTNVTGSDTNVDLRFLLKGNGVLSVVAGTGNYEDNVTSDDDVPNKKYVDDAVLAAAPSGGILTSKTTVSLSSNGTTSLGSIPANATILRVRVKVTTPSDAATILTIGDPTNGAASYMADSENDPEVAGVYISDCFVENGGSSVTANATVASAGTTGSCVVIIEYINA